MSEIPRHYDTWDGPRPSDNETLARFDQISAEEFRQLPLPMMQHMTRRTIVTVLTTILYIGPRQTRLPLEEPLALAAVIYAIRFVVLLLAMVPAALMMLTFLVLQANLVAGLVLAVTLAALLHQGIVVFGFLPRSQLYIGSLAGALYRMARLIATASRATHEPTQAR